MESVRSGHLARCRLPLPYEVRSAESVQGWPRRRQRPGGEAAPRDQVRRRNRHQPTARQEAAARRVCGGRQARRPRRSPGLYEDLTPPPTPEEIEMRRMARLARPFVRPRVRVSGQTRAPAATPDEGRRTGLTPTASTRGTGARRTRSSMSLRSSTRSAARPGDARSREHSQASTHPGRRGMRAAPPSCSPGAGAEARPRVDGNRQDDGRPHARRGERNGDAVARDGRCPASHAGWHATRS